VVPVPDLDAEVRAGGDIIVRVNAGAAILQLNRPAKRNALSQAMWEAICAALAQAAARRQGVRLHRPARGLLRGRGPRRAEERRRRSRRPVPRDLAARLCRRPGLLAADHRRD
jgi:hypothetical protein